MGHTVIPSSFRTRGVPGNYQGSSSYDTKPNFMHQILKKSLKTPPYNLESNLIPPQNSSFNDPSTVSKQSCRFGPQSSRQTLVSPIFRSVATACGSFRWISRSPGGVSCVPLNWQPTLTSSTRWFLRPSQDSLSIHAFARGPNLGALFSAGGKTWASFLWGFSQWLFLVP